MGRVRVSGSGTLFVIYFIFDLFYRFDFDFHLELSSYFELFPYFDFFAHFDHHDILVSLMFCHFRSFSIFEVVLRRIFLTYVKMINMKFGCTSVCASCFLHGHKYGM